MLNIVKSWPETYVELLKYQISTNRERYNLATGVPASSIQGSLVFISKCCLLYKYQSVDLQYKLIKWRLYNHIIVPYNFSK